ncbi:four helix bundle protein [Segatella copri]|uniref:Four helix bundle protein n=1 Tax=Segatella copri TaxID=165179 RepID=A0AAW5U161_9BACT|nr:four helix bundle protein [Segatella copri]MCW4094682.1 four helix bundle protein [Segatella copri]MCW4109331.1 four helix bundle protein [Segatella copri]
MKLNYSVAELRLSKKFAIRIIKLYVFLKEEKHEFVMSKQIYRCGTSIGANIAESTYAQSTPDYISKLSISLKEASETQYWLDLLQESNYITTEQYESISNDVKTIIGTLVNIINKLKQKNNQ